MCDMTAVAIGGELVGTVISGVSAKQRGDAAKAENFRSADAAERAASDAVERGNLKGQQVAAHGSMIVSQERVAVSGTGADVNIGAPKSIQLATEAATEGDKKIIAHNAQMEAYGLKSKARNLRQRGVNAQAEGDAAMVGTFLGGIAKVGGQVARRYADVPDSPGDTSYGGGSAPDEAD